MGLKQWVTQTVYQTGHEVTVNDGTITLKDTTDLIWNVDFSEDSSTFTLKNKSNEYLSTELFHYSDAITKFIYSQEPFTWTYSDENKLLFQCDLNQRVYYVEYREAQLYTGEVIKVFASDGVYDRRLTYDFYRKSG